MNPQPSKTNVRTVIRLAGLLFVLAACGLFSNQSDSPSQEYSAPVPENASAVTEKQAPPVSEDPQPTGYITAADAERLLPKFNLGDGVWGQLYDDPGNGMEMIAVRVYPDSDTGFKEFWVRSRTRDTDWSEGVFYETPEKAMYPLVEASKITRFKIWRDDAVVDP